MKSMALEALKGEQTVSELASRFGVHPTMIDRPNQVGCTGIACIPLARAFLYLVAIMDWWSRNNQQRPHAVHDGQTPDAVCRQADITPPTKMAA